MVHQGDLVVLVSTHSHPGDPAWPRCDCHPSSELSSSAVCSRGVASFTVAMLTSAHVQKVGTSRGALRPFFHLTLAVVCLGWHSGECWRLLILLSIKALVIAFLRGTALSLATVGELGMTVLVQVGAEGRENI